MRASVGPPRGRMAGRPPMLLKEALKNRLWVQVFFTDNVCRMWSVLTKTRQSARVRGRISGKSEDRDEVVPLHHVTDARYWHVPGPLCTQWLLGVEAKDRDEHKDV